MNDQFERLWRDQIATAVRRVKPIGFGGTCFDRLVIGAAALLHVGLEPKGVLGSTLFRAGPDEVLDVVAFCGPGNMACVPNLFHVWLEVDDCIVDFASGDWKEDAPQLEGLSAALLPETETLRPVQWDVDPPRYVWRPKAELTTPWTPTGTPELGELWYAEGVAASHQKEAQAYFDGGMHDATRTLHLLWPTVRDALPQKRSR